ncbi:MAG TPA: DUF4382 domain-containing protein [Gammaproteobacteria bacterium]
MLSARIVKTGTVLLCAGAVAACSSGSDDATGTLTLSLMDRPVDGVTELNVTISEVWLKPKGEGPAFELEMTSTPLKVNLLALDDENASVLVDEAVVPAGAYNWVELKIEDAEIADSYAMTTAGGMVPVDVDVPSGKIRLVSGFDVGANQAVRFLFDWDVRKGLTEAVGREGLLLRPAFRILDAEELGSINGTVAASTISGETSCQDVVDPNAGGKVVYVFAGDVTPDDIDGADPEPVTTADAVFNPGTGDYDYRAVVMPGDYTVAFTCQGADDTDDASEDLVFLAPTAGGVVTVTADTPVEDVDF